MYIPKYFTLYELFKSDTATKKGIANYPESFELVENLADLGRHLDKIRELANSPIYVNSAYRTKSLNRLVGGVNNSLHCSGNAGDLWSRTIRSSELYSVIARYVGFEIKLYPVRFENKDWEIIYYPNHGFIHFAKKKNGLKL